MFWKNKYNLIIAIAFGLMAIYTAAFVGPGHPDQLRITIGNLMQFGASLFMFWVYLKIKY
jgi:hypothetical protein